MACGLTPELARMLGNMGAEKEREAAAARRALEEATRARERVEEHFAMSMSSSSSSPPADEYDWTRAYGKWAAWEDPEELARREQEARERSERAAKQAHMGGCDHDHSAEQRLMDMSTADKQRACDDFRRLGNAFFAQGQFQRAAYHYHQALVYFEYMFPDTDAETRAMDALRARVLLNMAACRLKTQHLDDAVQHADQALELQPDSVKALFRRAQARRLRDEFELAEADLSRAIALAQAAGTSSELAALAQEKKLLHAKRLAYKLHSRQVSAAMFRGGKSSAGGGRKPAQAATLSLDARVMDLTLSGASGGADDRDTGELAFESWRPSTSGLAALEALVKPKRSPQ